MGRAWRSLRTNRRLHGFLRRHGRRSSRLRPTKLISKPCGRPAEDRAASRPAVEEEHPAAAQPPPAVGASPASDLEPEAPAGERSAVAILKSGVVDGMGYTLYVDGSIEAELPQGTLRFASINDLREHLEKTS